MKAQTREKIFSNLQMSKDSALDEIACLLAYNKLAEFTAEIEFYEKKHKKNFKKFEEDLNKTEGSFDKENDWMGWTFAIDGQKYWSNIIKEFNP